MTFNVRRMNYFKTKLRMDAVLLRVTNFTIDFSWENICQEHLSNFYKTWYAYMNLQSHFDFTL